MILSRGRRLAERLMAEAEEEHKPVLVSWTEAEEEENFLRNLLSDDEIKEKL